MPCFLREKEEALLGFLFCFYCDSELRECDLVELIDLDLAVVDHADHVRSNLVGVVDLTRLPLCMDLHSNGHGGHDDESNHSGVHANSFVVVSLYPMFYMRKKRESVFRLPFRRVLPTSILHGTT